MAISTYAELQTAVLNWLNRSDLSQRVPEFIALAEARFRRELKDWLRFSLSLTNLTGDTILASTVDEVLGASHNDGASGANNFPLRMVTREEYQRWMEFDANARQPTEVVFVDYDADAPSITLRFWPPASSSGPLANLRVEAVKVLPSLSATQTTNALLRDAPDVYLFGSLVEAGTYLAHDERLPAWEARLSQSVDALNTQSQRKIYGGQPRPRTLARVFG